MSEHNNVQTEDTKEINQKVDEIKKDNSIKSNLQNTGAQSKKDFQGTLGFQEIAKLRQVFDAFKQPDKPGISKNELNLIFSNLNKEIPDMSEIFTILSVGEDSISFDTFISVFMEVERRLAMRKNTPSIDNQDPIKISDRSNIESAGDGGLVIEIDPKVIEFLKMLDAYRIKCESNGEYGEAKKSKLKYDELKKKEALRQLNFIKTAQEKELKAIEEAQKAQFDEFSKAWDKYMTEYEATALQSLEKLKDRHIKELEEFNQRIKDEIKAKNKISKSLREIRDKEHSLIKMQKYDEAEIQKAKGDQLEIEDKIKSEAKDI